MGTPEDAGALFLAVQLGEETGELLGLVKRKFRGDLFTSDGTPVNAESMGDEAADIVISLDVLCQVLGIDLQAAIIKKFNATSEKIGSSVRLQAVPAHKWEFPKQPAGEADA